MRRIFAFTAAWLALLGMALLLFAPMPSLWHILWRTPLAWLLFIVWRTAWQVYPLRLSSLPSISPDLFGLVVEHVAFPSRDPLRMHGMFIKGRRSATILLVHGLGGGSNSVLVHAAGLARAGFSFFLVDLRGHGRSDGGASTFGHREAQDVLGALDYLRSRPDVDAEKIGGLGISLGAQALARAAAETDALAGIVLEGLGPMTLADHDRRPRTLRRWLNLPVLWFGYNLGNWMAGVRPEGTASVLERVHCPVLLVCSPRWYEQYFNSIFLEAANAPKELWVTARGGHAQGLYHDREVYLARLGQFFNQVFQARM